MEARALINRYMLRDDFLVMGDQSNVESIVIAKARLTQPGQIIVFNTDLFDSPGFNILGISEPLSAGVHENVLVPLDPEAHFHKEDRSFLITPASGMNLYVGIEHIEEVEPISTTLKIDKMGYPVVQKITLR